MKVEIEVDRITRETEIVEYDLPDETSYYFITGIRKSYKVVPDFADWDGGDGSLFQYHIVEVGLSFECVVKRYFIRVTEIPDIMENKDTYKPKYAIIQRIVMNPDKGVRTKERFERDLDTAISKIKFEGN